MELAFAGLHQLCTPMLSNLVGLPGPQRDALGTVFGLRTGCWSVRRRSGCCPRWLSSCRLCAWSMMRSGSIRPLRRHSRSFRACWPNRARWCSRCVSPARSSRGEACHRLPSGGLSSSDARALLDSVTPGRLDERVRDRIASHRVADACGNPLALLALPRGLSAAELADGFGVSEMPTLASRIERSFLRQLQSIPATTQRLLLAAAAEPIGEVTLLWRAAGRLGVGADAAAPVEAAGLIELGARMRFRHPLLRVVVYRAAAVPDRREVHRALAEATDPGADPDRRASPRTSGPRPSHPP
jgi:hypothetical protein